MCIFIISDKKTQCVFKDKSKIICHHCRTKIMLMAIRGDDVDAYIKNQNYWQILCMKGNMSFITDLVA